MKLCSSDNQMQRFCIQKHISEAPHMIRLRFVYILYSFYIVCMQKKHAKIVSVSQLCRFCIVCTLLVCARKIQRSFQLARCIGFVQFIHSLYVQKNAFQVSRCFQLELSTSFAQFVHFLYIYRSLMYIFCTFIIKQNFDFHHLCIQNIYKGSVLYNFCLHFVQFFYKFFGKGA